MEIGLGLGYPHAKELGEGSKGGTGAPVGGLFMYGCGFNVLIAHYGLGNTEADGEGSCLAVLAEPLGPFRFSSCIISSVPLSSLDMGGRTGMDKWMMEDTLSMKEQERFISPRNTLV